MGIGNLWATPRRWNSVVFPLAVAICLALASCYPPTNPNAAALHSWASTGGSPEQAEFRPFTFVHISDPHVGVLAGPDRRFAEMAGEINQLKPDFVVLTGDLTYGLTPGHQATTDAELKHLNVPVKLIPGNHDVYDLESLATYLAKYGKDYYAFTYRNCEFIFLDTAILDADSSWFHQKGKEFDRELQAQWAWLEKALANAHATGRQHIFVLLHIPPFVKEPDEVGGLTALSGPARQKLLSLTEKYHVEIVLAGHIHRTTDVQWGATHFYTVGGTYWPVDGNGYGYRVFRVEKDQITQRYVRLGSALPGTQPTSQESPRTESASRP